MRLKGLLILMLTFIVVLSGCWYGETIVTTNITQQDGGGSSTVTVEVWNDDVAKPDGNGNVDDNSDYFPNGLQPVLEYLQGAVPDYATVTLTSDSDKNYFNLTYTFSDFDQYKARTLELTALGSLPAQPTFTTAAATGGVNVTFTDNKANATAIVQNFFGQVYVDPDLFDPTHGTGEPANALTVADSFRMKAVTIKVGDNTDSFDLLADASVALTVTGFISDEAVEENPETGDLGYSMYVILAALAGAALLFMNINRKRTRNQA